MDEEELEKIRKNLEKVEFNNDEEDSEEIEEDLRRVEYLKKVDSKREREERELLEEKPKEIMEKEENIETNDSSNDEIKEESNLIEKPVRDDSFDDDSKDNKTIIILGVILGVLLVIVLFLVGSLLFNGESSRSGSNGSNDESIYKDEGKPSTSKVDISKGSSYFINEKYLYLKDNEIGYITDIEGKVIYQDDDNSCLMMSNSYFMCERHDNSKVKYVIKKVEDSGSVQNIAHENDFNVEGRIIKSGNQVVGYYSEDKNKTHLTIIHHDTLKDINFDYLLFNEGSNNSYTRKIYGDKYFIITDSSMKLYGLYDIVNEKVLIKPKYKELVYLYDDLFVAAKNDKSGIINSNDDVKVDFKYDVINYSNGLYIVGNGNVLRVLNKNYQEIGDTLKVKSLSDYDYYNSNRILKLKSFSDKVILLKDYSNNQSQYAVVDSSGKFMDYEFTKFSVIGDRVVTQKDNQLTLYDSSFNKIQEFNIPNSIPIDLNTAVIYLNDNLVFNGCYVFDINSGNYLYQMNHLSRSYQGYFVDLNFKDGIGTADVSLEDKKIGSIEKVDVSEFLKADNNGIRLTNEYFIFSVGDKNLIIKR